MSDGRLVPGLADFLARVNAHRRARDGVGEEARVLEEAAETLFRCREKLAVYGSLRPGRENHELLEELAGRWSEGVVRGHLLEEGWGATMGYPAMRWDPAGEAVPVSLLASGDLPDHWNRLDRFEGEAYVRILVPVEGEEGPVAVANLYALAE